MKKVYLLFLCFILGQAIFALEVVYPKKPVVMLNTPSTFFVGSSNPSKDLYINGTKVPVHPSGGFAYPVSLKIGENTFELKSGQDKLNYKITRTYPKKTSVSSQKYIEYANKKYGTVKTDLTPLRTEPVDGGINRLSHLQTGIPVEIYGEKNGFYKVKLTYDNFGWVMKNQVNLSDKLVESVELKGCDFYGDEEYANFIFHLSGRTLWSIEETSDKLSMKLYGIKGYKNELLELDINTADTLQNKPIAGYNAYFNGNDFILKIRKPMHISERNPFKGVKIVLDPGHGGNELGAIGCLGDKEKDINLKYVKDLAKKLKASGAEVVLTRDDDSFVSLQDRVIKTNSEDAFIFISIHGNALPDTSNPLTVSGAEVYYYYNQAKPLADEIMQSFVQNAGMKNHGIYQRSFAVVRNSAALSILIEVGYLINPGDNAKIISDEFRKKAVDAIFDGIENYLKSLI